MDNQNGGSTSDASVQREIDSLITEMQPNRPSEGVRSEIVELVRRAVQPLNFKVFLFGSCAFKTYLPDGDIDLTVTVPEASPDTHVNILNNVKTAICQYLNIHDDHTNIVAADVKVLKIVIFGVYLDISVNQFGGLNTLCFLQSVDDFINRDHLFKRSLLLVKSWCYYKSHILGAGCNLIGTYALTVMLLCIFNLFDITNPLQALLKFLEYFSKCDFNKDIITTYGPIPITYFLERRKPMPNVAAKPPSNFNFRIPREKMKQWRKMFSDAEVGRPPAGAAASDAPSNPETPATPVERDLDEAKTEDDYPKTESTLSPESTPAGTPTCGTPAALEGEAPLQTEESALSDDDDRDQWKHFQLKSMNILDPLRPFNNLARGVNRKNMLRIRDALAKGYEELVFLNAVSENELPPEVEESQLEKSSTACQTTTTYNQASTNTSPEWARLCALLAKQFSGKRAYSADSRRDEDGKTMRTRNRASSAPHPRCATPAPSSPNPEAQRDSAQETECGLVKLNGSKRESLSPESETCEKVKRVFERVSVAVRKAQKFMQDLHQISTRLFGHGPYGSHDPVPYGVLHGGSPFFIHPQWPPVFLPPHLHGHLNSPVNAPPLEKSLLGRFRDTSPPREQEEPDSAVPATSPLPWKQQKCPNCQGRLDDLCMDVKRAMNAMYECRRPAPPVNHQVNSPVHFQHGMPFPPFFNGFPGYPLPFPYGQHMNPFFNSHPQIQGFLPPFHKPIPIHHIRKAGDMPLQHQQSQTNSSSLHPRPSAATNTPALARRGGKQDASLQPGIAGPQLHPSEPFVMARGRGLHYGGRRGSSRHQYTTYNIPSSHTDDEDTSKRGIAAGELFASAEPLQAPAKQARSRLGPRGEPTNEPPTDLEGDDDGVPFTMPKSSARSYSDVVKANAAGK